MRTPQSTYRLQISDEFTLFDAAERLDALAAMLETDGPDPGRLDPGDDPAETPQGEER